MANQSSSAEQIAAYLEALGRELDAYEKRIAVAKDSGRDRLSVEQLEARVELVKAEQKRASALLGEQTKSKSKRKAAEA